VHHLLSPLLQSSSRTCAPLTKIWRRSSRRQKREREEKQLAEKNYELIQKEGEFEMKRKVDSETLQKQQKEINGLRKYMETAEKHWDLLNEDVMGMNPEVI
jgi:hypothetical protein